MSVAGHSGHSLPSPSTATLLCLSLALHCDLHGDFKRLCSCKLHETQKIGERSIYVINPLTPNDHYGGRTAPLTSKRCILYIYSTN